MCAGCLPSKTQQSTKNRNTRTKRPAVAPPPPPPSLRYPPRQPLNLWRCDNVDAAFCMLDCCRIHSRFLPSTTSIRSLTHHARVSERIQPATASCYPAITTTTTIGRTVATVIYYLLELVWMALLPMYSGFRLPRQSTMSCARQATATLHYSLSSLSR